MTGHLPRPMDAAAAKGIAHAFLPERALGNRYDYYYTLTKLRTDPLYPGVLDALRGIDAPLLDLGCGLGLLAHALRLDGQAMPYLGVDIDTPKIERARRIAAKARLADTRFDVVDLAAGYPPHAGSVAILDVLQFLTREQQATLLDAAIAMLAPGTVLVMRAAQAPRAAALQASSSSAMRMRSRPDWIANGVTPQSGIDSTSTRSARPLAKPVARASRASNSSRYASTLRPRYWLLTPISSEAKSNLPSGSVASIAAESSSVVQPVAAILCGSASATPSSRSARASWTGQRPPGSTPSPMV